MIKLTPEEIKEHLKSRISAVNRLRNAINDRSDKSDEIENSIYFQYYFCFSTAIEVTVYNIMLKKYNDEFLKSMLKIESKSLSKYIHLDDAKKLINNFGSDITFDEIKKFYSEENIIRDRLYNQQPLSDKLYSKYQFSDLYNRSRDMRNKLAHGLVLQNVNYDERTLFDFMCSFYILHKYYKFVLNE